MRPLVALTALLLPLTAFAADPAPDGADAAPAGPPVPEGCASRPVGVDGVYEAMEFAKMSIAAGDRQGFLDALTYTNSVFPCLSEPVPRRMAAEVHRLYGLRALLTDDPTGAGQAFAAARAIEPHYRFAAGSLPGDLDVAPTYEAVDLEAGAFEPIPPGAIELDGRPADERPTDWPTIAQVFHDDGAVRSTRWVAVGEPLPDYRIDETPAAAVAASGAVALPTRSPPEPRLPLVAATGGAAVLGTTLFVAAHATRGKWANTDTPYSDLERLERRTNTLTTLSLLSGIATAGLGVGVVATW